MNVLVLGGSNSFMADGYIAYLARMLGEKLQQPIVTTNLSVGGTTSLMGFEMLHRFPEESCAAIELVIIEFCINDYPLVRGENFSFWESSYEGLVRRCLRTFPGVPIVSILFGRRDEPFYERQMKIKSKIISLDGYYNNHYTVDVDGMLHDKFADVERFKRLYKDPAHYRANFIEQISEYLADEFFKVISKHDAKMEFPSDFYFTYCFDRTHLVLSQDIDVMQRSKFSNSRISYDTAAISLDEKLEISLPGPAIAVSYISSKASGVLDIGLSGGKYSIYTLMKLIADEKYSFLLKNTSISWRVPQPGRGPETLALRASRDISAKHKLQPQWNMLPPIVETPSVYLTGILCDTTP